MVPNGVARLGLHQQSWSRLIHHPVPQYPRPSRAVSTDAKNPSDVSQMLGEPSWSVQSLLQSTDDSPLPKPSVTKKQLHHLLRLSALPLPASENEEARMMGDLEAQLRFVQAVQKVDTEGVEPLQSIRDESKAGEKLRMATVQSLRAEFSKEVVVGKRGRIIKKENLPPVDEESVTESDNRAQLLKELLRMKTEVDEEPVTNWNPLAQAPRRLGQYFVVETDKD